MEVIRAAEETQPLGMKSSDVKVITNAENSAVKVRAASKLHFSQRGFAYQRQFLNNFVGIDTHARVFNIASWEAIIALFDVKAAPPKSILDLAIRCP